MNGRSGEVYNIGGGRELSNNEITSLILEAMGANKSSIEYVEDRKGHDFRYGIDTDTRDLQIAPFIFNMTTLFEDITRNSPNKIQLRFKTSELHKTLFAMEKIIKGERIVGNNFKTIITKFYVEISKNNFELDKNDLNYALCIFYINTNDKEEGGKNVKT
jgi:hypothetical protein